jgi:putative copper resistance protein D
MEHSLLHALQLVGMITVLGGTFFVLVFLSAARTKASFDGEQISAWETITRHWSFWAAVIAGLGAVTDLFVQVAEVNGATIYGGVQIAEMGRFIFGTFVGRAGFIKALLLFAVALCLKGKWKWQWPISAFLGTAAGIASSLVSHSAALPHHRIGAIAAQALHLFMGAVWIGTLVQLFACRKLYNKPEPKNEVRLLSFIVNRFSPIALMAALLVFCSGFYALWRFLLQTPEAAITSPYGITLLIKLALLTVMLFAAWVNWRRWRPALSAISPDILSKVQSGSIIQHFVKTLELEVTAGLFVIAIAGILAGIAPPGEEGVYRLNQHEFKRLFKPDWPTSTIVNPAKFVGAEERTVEDLRYAEFTHNWSGVLVLALGILWLGQSVYGGQFYRRTWPLLLVPFGFFIAIAADPEIWILRKVSLLQVLRDPQLIEHQIGTALVFVLVWLGWKDGKKSDEEQPLGYPLPILMICGSLMLLGHAHSNLSGSEHLTTLINVQHGIFGGLGLSGGIVRWFQLRSLVPRRIAMVVWPACVMGLGIFMAFFYREVM